MKTFVTALLLAAAALPAAAGVTKDDVKKLAAAKLGDDVIVAFIRANGGGAKLSADDLVELKEAGVSETVMKALVSSAKETPSAAAPRQTDDEAMRILNRVQVPSSESTTVYATQPTYTTTYVTTPSYSSWYYPGYSYGPYYSYGYYPSYSYWGGGCHSYSHHSSSIHHHHLGSFKWSTRR